jgi:hypothetical protein
LRIKGRDENKISFWFDGINDGLIKIIMELPKAEGPPPEENEELEVYIAKTVNFMEGSRNLTLKAGEITQSQLPSMIPKGNSLIAKSFRAY